MASLLLGVPTMATASQTLSHCSRISFSQSLSSNASFPSSSSNLSISFPNTNFPPSLPSVYCGRGDRKTERGKRFNHSFGNARPRNKKKGRGPPRVPVPSLPKKEDPFDDGQVVKIDIDDSPFSN